MKDKKVRLSETDCTTIKSNLNICTDSHGSGCIPADKSDDAKRCVSEEGLDGGNPSKG